MNRKEKNKGKAIYFLWEELPSRKRKWEVKVIQEILRRNWKKETGKNYKERDKQLKDNFVASEGKWRQRGKNTMQINNEEEEKKRRMYKLEPFEGPIDDWFKLRMKTGRVWKIEKKKKHLNVELEQQN